MEMPKLRVRPMSTQVCTNFGGLDRRAGAGGRGQSYGGWRISWRDERNLSSDRAPHLSVRRGKVSANNIEGYPGIARITAVNVQGDHLVILDETGLLWCNGHSMSVITNQGDGPLTDYRIETATGNAKLTITRMTAVYIFASNFADIWATTHGATRANAYAITLRYDEGDGTLSLYDEETEEEYDQETWTPAEIGCTLTGTPADGDLFRFISVMQNPEEASRMITMGALTCIPDAAGGLGLWVNTVDLAAGRTMILGQNYGSMGAKTLWIAGDITLQLCDVDGNPYSGVAVSASEPAQTGLWLETGGGKAVLHEWRAYTSEWIVVDKTYVRIKLGYVTVTGNIPNIYHNPLNPLPHLFKAGDTIRLETVDDPIIDYNDVYHLLNGTHYVQAVVDGDIVVAGILDDTERIAGLGSGSYAPEAGGIVDDTHGYVKAERVLPQMDYVVESGNRLWGCFYGEQDGKTVNEIYASKLGDPTNWEVFQGLSTDSWRASRGVSEPYTGAAVLSGCPLFFREDGLEKVYPSSSGAHQIQTFTLEGVEQGAANSICLIENRLYYKSRLGVMCYTGTMPQLVSLAWGDMKLTEGSAARHGRKYCLSTVDADGEGLVAVYDTESGDWHLETEPWEGLAVAQGDELYYLAGGEIYRRYAQSNSEIEWYAETEPLAFVPEHVWLSYLRLRFTMPYRTPRQTPTWIRVYVSYEDGPWQLKSTLHQMQLNTQELVIWPERRDNFRLRLEGTGDCELVSLSFRMERSEGGH